MRLKKESKQTSILQASEPVMLILLTNHIRPVCTQIKTSLESTCFLQFIVNSSFERTHEENEEDFIGVVASSGDLDGLRRRD